MNDTISRRRLVALALAAATVSAACTKDDGAKAATPGDTKAAGAGGTPGGGRPGGGRGGSVTLAQTDIAPVRRGTIEDAVQITGNLRPIETVDVRARLEGDLDAVYVREGQRVGAGTLLARFEAHEQESGRRSAEADREAARSDLATAQWNLDQSRDLFKAGAVAERDVRVSEQAVAAARARLVATESRITATSSAVSDTRVLAPTSGTIEKRMVEAGEHVARGAPMFTLVRSDALELAANVPSRASSGVKEGQPVHFIADGRKLSGRVSRVSSTIDPATRSFTLYAQLANPGGIIKGGTFATGRVVGRTVNDALLLPVAAVRQSPDGSSYVFRITAGALERAPVALGIVDDEQGVAEVVSGLNEGDRVVSGNVGTLGAGMKVQIIGGGEGGRRAGGAPGGGAPAGAARTR